MSESILKALMRLFAIIASDQEEGSGREVVASYLKQQLNQELVDEFLALYDQYCEEHSSKKGKKKLSSNSVKVLAICERVNEELRQEQKVLVLLQLFEFINFNGQVSENEMEFVKTVAEVFNISKEEYEDCKGLIMHKAEDMPDKSNMLIISNDKNYSHPEFKHLYNENLNGYIVMLFIKSTNMYAFGYLGEDTLYLNGHVINPKRVYILVKGSSIRNPRISPIYYSDIVGKYLAAETGSKVVFAAKDVEFRFKNSTNGIHNFNFYAESGEMIGVMGGSGAGKSTLLNVFNGNLAPQKGEITINGYNIYTEKKKLEGYIGFVPQDDLLIEELTVYQNLYYNAKLCFNNFTEKQIVDACERVLHDLDLFEIRHLKVGSPLKKFISGGQRKRLNIALELIREPAVLFVDEPTSGLSSMDSEMVMDLLKEITLKGKLCIVNIHQPSSDIYKLFDKLVIMDRGGHPIYYGNPVDAVVYFKKMTNHVNADEAECLSCGNVNPEQVLSIVETKVVDEYGKLTRARKISSKEWYDMYKKNIESKVKPVETTDPLPVNHFKIPNLLKQFWIFTIRDVLSKLTNRQYMIINFLEAPALAFILGYFTKYVAGTPDDPNKYLFSENENLPGYLFMCVIVSLFLGMTVSAEEIIRDRKILQRERFLNLSRFAYINSKVLLMFLISAIQTLSFIFIGNTILGIEGMTIPFWLILFTTSCCANLVGLNISSALDSVVTIYILIPFILVPQLLLSGTIVKFDKLNNTLASDNFVPIVGDMMTSRWAYEALVVYQYKNNEYNSYFFDIETEKSRASFKTTFLIPELINKLTNIETNIPEYKKSKDDKLLYLIEKDFRILRNEISALQKAHPEIKFGVMEYLNMEDFNPKVSKMTNAYLAEVKDIYMKVYKEFLQKYDDKIKVLQQELGEEKLETVQNEYFKNNAYYKLFFELEVKKALAFIRANEELPELLKNLEYLEKNVPKYRKDSVPEVGKLIEENFSKLWTGINTYKLLFTDITFERTAEDLNVDSIIYDDITYTKNYLVTLKEANLEITKNGQKEFEKRLVELKQVLGNEAINEMREQHQNINLEDLVLNKQEIKKILETEDRLIQRSDPIYRDPESSIGRAHFYAPYKKIFGISIDTFWFNIFFIWLTSLVIYLTLWHDSIRKLMEVSGRIRIGKKKSE
ncbi:MAG: hypothetical protein A2W91_15665 [Bacteroidetes bacterium GWF2_38_335]|nr:MAG: hypothetical protein A2W91_15665 [Bacteroidetes bacterium GWF2_38_335]OFY81529.1 MAG: hypothetical protein A2281_11525 [Bacteroidetes bacterium RIFOXYA12_FULL_38_20]HBS87700.1 ABC transporter [Bacteroidales bacterium]